MGRVSKLAAVDVSRFKGIIMRRGIAAFILFAVSFAVFVPTLKNGFVWDDLTEIVARDSSLNFSNTISKIEHTGRKYHYRPILFSSWVVDYKIWGLSPFGFHLSNVLFHSINSVIFYFFAILILAEFRINNQNAIAFASALFFAINPIHVETVSFISARADILCSIFLLIAFVFHILSFRRLWLTIVAALSFSLSLLSKEVAIAFPALIVVFDLLTKRIANRGNLLRYSMYALLLIFYLYLRSNAIGTVVHKLIAAIPSAGAFSAYANESSSGLSMEGLRNSSHGLHWDFINLTNQWFLSTLKASIALFGAYLFYIRKLVFPFDLNPFVGTVPEGFYQLLFPVLLLFLLIVVFRSLRRGRAVIAFLLCWVVISLGPAAILAITKLSATPVAERFLYIPSAGFCLLIGYLFITWYAIAKFKKTILGLMFLLCAFYLTFTINGQRVWKDDLTLWESAVKRSPSENTPHVNYGTALMRAGRNADAIKQFLIVVDPNTKDKKTGKTLAAHNLGLIYLEFGDFENAEKWFRKAYHFNRKYEDRYNYYMGLVYYSKGIREYSLRNEYEDFHLADFEEAKKFFTKALQKSNHRGELDLLLAKTYVYLGEIKSAKEHATKAIKSGELNGASLKEAEDIVLKN
jgi:tetratricopeptide (TPR) repeat protein